VVGAGAVVAHEGAGAGLGQPVGAADDIRVDDHFGCADAVVDGEGPGGPVQVDDAAHASGVAVGVRGGGHVGVQGQRACPRSHGAAVHGQRPDRLVLVVQVEAAREVDGDGGVVGDLTGIERAHDVGVEVAAGLADDQRPRNGVHAEGLVQLQGAGGDIGGAG